MNILAFEGKNVIHGITDFGTLSHSYSPYTNSLGHLNAII